MRWLKSLLPLLALVLAACSTAITARVTVFHELAPLPQGAKYAFIQSKAQQGSLEHKAYEDMVRQQLAKYGFREVAVKEADLAVFLSYEIDNGKEVISTYPIFGQTGVSSSYTYTNIYRDFDGRPNYARATTYFPSYGIVGTGTAFDVVYTTRVQLDLLSRPLLDQGKTLKLYEGKVVSSGAGSQMNEVMPYMIRALFLEFPGNSGTTKTVEIPLSQP